MHSHHTCSRPPWHKRKLQISLYLLSPSPFTSLLYHSFILPLHLSHLINKLFYMVSEVQSPARTLLRSPAFLMALRQDPPLEAILVIFGRRALFFFVWKLLEKNEKWHHFCAHAQWWSPWRRKNVEKGHLTLSNLTFLLIAIDTNGFRRMKEEGLIYKTLSQIF